jgi:hypothetical protein
MLIAVRLLFRTFIREVQRCKTLTSRGLSSNWLPWLYIFNPLVSGSPSVKMSWRRTFGVPHRQTGFWHFLPFSFLLLLPSLFSDFVSSSSVFVPKKKKCQGGKRGISLIWFWIAWKLSRKLCLSIGKLVEFVSGMTWVGYQSSWQ